MFREIILPIFRSTRLCVTACGVMNPPRCCRPKAGNITPLLNTGNTCNFSTAKTVTRTVLSSFLKIVMNIRCWKRENVCWPAEERSALQNSQLHVVNESVRQEYTFLGWWRNIHCQVTVRSWSLHGQFTVRSRLSHGLVTEEWLASESNHLHVVGQCISQGYGIVTVRLRYSNGQVTVR